MMVKTRSFTKLICSCEGEHRCGISFGDCEGEERDKGRYPPTWEIIKTDFFTTEVGSRNQISVRVSTFE